MLKTIGFLCVVSLFIGGMLFTNDPSDQDKTSIRGSYIEARTSDVWTGPCFANGEVNLAGEEAVLAWSVESGHWQGVNLDGMKIVAVLKASATLGDPYAEQLPAKSVMIVDDRATKEQSEALVDLAKALGGELLEDVVAVKLAPVVTELTASSGFAYLKAGDIVEMRTRAFNHHDMFCGNESVYYPPLTSIREAKPAYTLAHRFSGDGLGATWSSPHKRSAFIGRFAR